MNNPAIRIWAESQIIYVTIHFVALIVSALPAIIYNGDMGLNATGFLILVAGISCISEFVFALPAIPFFAILLRLLRTAGLTKPPAIAISITGLLCFMYLCSQLLLFVFTDSSDFSKEDLRSGYYFFTGLALFSAVIATLINHRRLYQYICRDNVQPYDATAQNDSLTQSNK